MVGKKTNQKTSQKTSKLQLPNKPYFKASYIVCGVVAIILFAFVLRVAIWEHNYLSRMEGSEREVTDSSTHYQGNEDVDESVPNSEEYHVAPDRPRYLSIPTLNILNARVVEVSQIDNGQIDTPHNIHDIGWYNGIGSVVPGQFGTAVLDGHGGNMGNGILKNLPSINIGDEIIIEMGDETTKYTYRVADTVTKNLSEANSYMVTAFSSPEADKPSLTLITCTGDYIWNKQDYSERLFVRAVLENE